MADEAAEVGVGEMGELGGRGALVLGFLQPDLDQLMVGQRRVDGRYDALRQAPVPDLDEGTKWVGEPTQILALEAPQGFLVATG